MEEFIKNQLTKIENIRKMYGNLFANDTPIVPIPFFGNIYKAKIITVGVNPSADELRTNNWHSTMSHHEIMEKLIHYYQDNPHPWFKTWEQALNQIDYSYYDGTAAHVDICSWGTKSISTLRLENNMSLFEMLLTSSIPDYYTTLEFCKNATHIVLAGAATKSKYINEFLYAHNSSEIALLGKPKRESPAPYINWHTTKIKNKEIPTLSCSISPSARGTKKEDLVLKIKENIHFFH